MSLFNRKYIAPPSSPIISNTTRIRSASLATNSAYGRGFFEPGAYSIVLKRCENGHDLAQQLADMFDERAQIELAYANQLRHWSYKWRNELSKSQEYGTNKKVWDQLATTGEPMAYVHSTLSASLSESLIPNLRQWRKEHYERYLLHYKKTKEFERDFLDAQKSWNKLLDKISECKSMYYSACKASKLASEAENKSIYYLACKSSKLVDDAESKSSGEQRKKLADKADTARREIVFTRTKYQQAINEAREQRPNYESTMKTIFERTQAFEKRRLDFFKETYDQYAKILEIATIDNSILKTMNANFKASLLVHDSLQDLIWWDQNYGTQTNSRWPEYEEYID
ncbi:unnamed protein product [Adineta steineri]|uniref:F-BAR domain-containing protein n=1 Tax=Adineta steineri TaxID=433720 RepID=A0A814B8X7_9BILA|nr:unnamed protein product [Adineta steineri]CAF3857823.1 unnamed protein product [Adineta steineri]